jgi:hypothetical protein
VYKFLKQIGPDRRPFVKDITFQWLEFKGKRHIPRLAMEQLYQTSPLKRLTVVTTYDKRLTKGLSRNFFKAAGAKKLLELRGCKEIGFVNKAAGFLPWWPMDWDGSVVEFEKVVRKENARQPEIEKGKEDRLAEERQERKLEEAEKRRPEMDPKWQTGLRPRLQGSERG